jgi:hypothetical protein
MLLLQLVLLSLSSQCMLRVTLLALEQVSLLLGLIRCLARYHLHLCHRRCSEPLDYSDCYAIVECDGDEMDRAMPPLASR